MCACAFMRLYARYMDTRHGYLFQCRKLIELLGSSCVHLLLAFVAEAHNCDGSGSDSKPTNINTTVNNTHYQDVMPKRSLLAAYKINS